MRKAMLRPFLGCLVLFAVLAVTGCSGDKTKGGGADKTEKTMGRSTRRPTLADDGGPDERRGPVAPPSKGGDRPARDAKSPSDAAKPPSGVAKAPDLGSGRPDSREPKMAEPAVGGVSSGTGQKGPRAGTLTAGSFDDNRDPEPYRKFFRQIGQDSVLRDLPGRFLGHRLVLTVRDGAGNPVNNARVAISSEGGPSVELLTRTDGRVVFIPAFDQVPADSDFHVTVSPPGGAAPVTQTVARTAIEQTITVPTFSATPPRELDLALVVDTTGSMGDELEYLKSEMRSIVRSVQNRFPQVHLRIALIFYRDKGDQYVTRKFDFTTSVDDVRKNLQAQSAAGGGDTPEAMDKALEDAVALQWRTGNAARMMFLVADAPPHTEDMPAATNSVNALRKKGVAIFPIACSGYDSATEFVMRTSAMITGGQFLFLTDDSGVGNTHAEPHLTNYHVERLDKLMIRMIAGELEGKRVVAQPNDILRTVGRPQ